MLRIYEFVTLFIDLDLRYRLPPLGPTLATAEGGNTASSSASLYCRRPLLKSPFRPSVIGTHKMAPGSSLELEDEELVSWATARAARRATASFQWVPAVDIIPAQAAVSQSRPSSTRLASHGHAPALRSSVLRALHPAMQQDGEQRHEWQPMRAGPVPCIVWTGQTRGRSRNGRIRRQRHDRAAAAVRQGRQIVRGDGRHGPE